MTAAKPSEPSAKRKVRFDLCQTQETTAVLCSVIHQIFNFRRLLPAAILSAALAAALFWAWNGQEPLTPLVILSVLIAALEWGLILYLRINQPRLLGSIREMDGIHYTLCCDGEKLTLTTGGSHTTTYEKKEMLAQYWLEEHYFLLVEKSKKRRLIHVPVNKETFDDILLMAGLLEKRKVKFIKLQKKQTKSTKGGSK